MPNDLPLDLSRRQMLGAGLSTVLIASTPLTASATPADMLEAQKALFGDRPIQDGRVFLKLPPISENGFSVPLSVSVDSPMTDSDYVKQIAVFSPRNPLADIMQVKLGPQAGRADFSTRIRLSGTQAVTAVAEMSDGSLWSGAKETVVTLAACVVL